MKTYTTETFIYDQKFGHLKLMFDGSCSPQNPNGDMGYGWALFEGESLVAEGWGYQLYDGTETTTNNIAEWRALYLGMEYLAKKGAEYKSLTVMGDSKMVVNQAGGFWKTDPKKAYGPIAVKWKTLIKPHFGTVDYIWVPRERNEYCDMLSNKYIEHLRAINY